MPATVIPMQENILQTKCMGMESISLQMAIDMKAHGTKGRDRALECMNLGMVTDKGAIGSQEVCRLIAHTPFFLVPLWL